MPFSQFKLHPDLLRGVKDLGFARPTPIQADAIPPALEGSDLLGVRADGQRQDRRVPAADSQRADAEAAHAPAPRARWSSRRRASSPRRFSRI